MKQITCPHCADTYPDFDVAHVCSRGPYAPKLKPTTNERIQELAEQCYENDQSWTGVGQRIFNKEKFARLIVQECIDELDGKIYRAIDHEGDETWPDLILKEHFGVE